MNYFYWTLQVGEWRICNAQKIFVVVPNSSIFLLLRGRLTKNNCESEFGFGTFLWHVAFSKKKEAVIVCPSKCATRETKKNSASIPTVDQMSYTPFGMKPKY